MSQTAAASPRRTTYYWKCDRPAAFHGTAERAQEETLEPSLREALRDRFPGEALTLRAAGGQGNHRTFCAEIGETAAFVRVEDGPERDDYLEVESRVLTEVRAI